MPEKFNIALDVCGRWAAERSRFALYYEDESGFTSAHTFWDIQRQANRLANVLAALGTLAGDRVAILLPQCPETAIAHVAIYQMGALAVPLSHLFGPDALEYRLGDSAAHVAIVDDSSLPKLLALRDRLPQLRHVIGVGAALGNGVKAWAEVLEHASPRYTPALTAADDAAMIICTSGTTGKPKGALMAHRTLLGNLSGYVCSHDFFHKQTTCSGRRRIGMDRRSLGRAFANLALRNALARVQRPFRRRQGVRADGEVRHSQRFPLSNGLEDDDEGRARATSAVRSRSAQHHECWRTGR